MIHLPGLQPLVARQTPKCVFFWVSVSGSVTAAIVSGEAESRRKRRALQESKFGSNVAVCVAHAVDQSFARLRLRRSQVLKEDNLFGPVGTVEEIESGSSGL
jgi:hypothetical protein